MSANANAWRSPTDLLGEMAQRVAVGDLIGGGRNFDPHYHVVAVTEDRAWIRDIRLGTNHVIQFDRCRKFNGGGE